VVVVSGRLLADIRKRVGLTEIFYIGNHGFEIEGPNLQLDGLLSEPVRKDFDRLKEELKKAFVGMNGVWVEDKHVTLSIHYRQADEATIARMKTAFAKICNLYAVGEKIKIYPGNKVLEIRPPVDWDKGKAVLWFLSKQPAAPEDRKVLAVCVGDDATDEDVFEAVAQRGLTIRVGQDDSSKARYYLPDTQSVTRFLTAVLDVMSAPPTKT
jgi:trehalose 6-phosphate phosphatase